MTGPTTVGHYRTARLLGVCLSASQPTCLRARLPHCCVYVRVRNHAHQPSPRKCHRSILTARSVAMSTLHQCLKPTKNHLQTVIRLCNKHGVCYAGSRTPLSKQSTFFLIFILLTYISYTSDVQGEIEFLGVNNREEQDTFYAKRELRPNLTWYQ